MFGVDYRYVSAPHVDESATLALSNRPCAWSAVLSPAPRAAEKRAAEEELQRRKHCERHRGRNKGALDFDDSAEPPTTSTHD